jgi:hypothetical protein
MPMPNKSLEGALVRPLASEAHGFVLVTKGDPPTQISCGSAKEKEQWTKAIKAANGAAVEASAPLSMRPPAAVAPRPGKRELLREAIQRQDAAAVTQLLGDGASPDEALADGTPPLCAAVAQAKGGVDIVLLLTAAGANVGGRDVRSTTPLMKAARLGNAEVLQVLLESVGPATSSGGVLDLLDSKQQSALSLACASGHLACAELLLGSGSALWRTATGCLWLRLRGSDLFGNEHLFSALYSLLWRPRVFFLGLRRARRRLRTTFVAGGHSCHPTSTLLVPKGATRGVDLSQ